MKLPLFPLSARVLVGIALIASACSQGAGKERCRWFCGTMPKTAQCRAYADAWQTSPEEDMRRLPLRELTTRGWKMTLCYTDVELTRVKTVDKETFEKGVTYEDAINALIYAGKYSILVRAYFREASARGFMVEDDPINGPWMADPPGSVSKSLTACPPEHFTVEERIRVFVKFVDDHPEQLFLDSAEEVVWNATAAAYPCPTKTSP